jgi:signal transduction histidine kinase/CheY-like chemotaxis protein
MLSLLDSWLFDSTGLTAHGFCLLWQPGLIWTYALSDIGIALAYFSIPLVLAMIARRRHDFDFRGYLWLFAAFILLCGLTHWLDVLTLWAPAYGLLAVVKALTAVVSICTAVALWRLLPTVMYLPSPAQLQQAKDALRQSEERLAQSQKMETVGQLTGGIAHDFNNMIQVIQGGLAMMERRIEQGRSEDVVKYIAAMRQASESAAGLTNRLLAFSRRQALNPAPIEPDTLVGGMEELIRRTLGPSIDLELKLRDGRWAALCDANQLESALLNLAVNARDAMPAGGALTIATADRWLDASDTADHDDVEPGKYVEFAVTDTGEGMDSETLTRVFEPFFTTKPIGQGTGLGLSQVHGFVKQSGGFIRISSRPGQGTCVRLFLPGREKETTEAAAPDVRERPAASAQAGGAVLVVEDQDSVRAQIVEALTDIGCVVFQANDGPQGLKTLQAHSGLDLLVTDVGLPGLNGRQLAEAGRTLHPNLRVLLVTGYAGKSLEDARLPQGMEILRKPFTLDQLVDRARELLKTTV